MHCRVKPNPQPTAKGFTLAELLIALLILGEIATFTIPKILSAQQVSYKIAASKDVAAMISGAFQQAQLAGVITTSTKPADLIPYMNYVSLDTSNKTVDSHPNWVTSLTCDSSNPCVKLHNGGYLWFNSSYSFGGTNSNYTIGFSFDPDPNNNTVSTADGPLKTVQFHIYYNGLLRTRGTVLTGSCSSAGCVGLGPNPNLDPSWFTWD